MISSAAMDNYGERVKVNRAGETATVSHGLGTENVIVQVRSQDGREVPLNEVTSRIVDANTVMLDFYGRALNVRVVVVA